ncbi:MAG: RnfABCDGE type electron transport complex subunit D [Kiritimatiellia bacterium]
MAEETAPLWMLSSSPHTHAGTSVRGIMRDVLIALIPTLLMSIWVFEFEAVRLVCVCSSACLLAEYGARKLMGRNAGIDDLSALVTGVLLAFNLPPLLPSWMAAVGSVFAIVIVKQVFGGIGYNIFNPALAARVFLLISFPVAMTTWALPDAITTATPLGAWKTALANGAAPADFCQTYPLAHLFVGKQLGSIGEVSELAILLGGLYLLARRIIFWEIPVFYIATVAVFTAILHAVDPVSNLSPLYHLATGGLFLGAFFMATDMVTSPVTRRGQMVYGLCCGLLTVVIRRWGGYPEGVSFAILIMNAFSPLVEKLTEPRAYGHLKKAA